MLPHESTKGMETCNRGVPSGLEGPGTLGTALWMKSGLPALACKVWQYLDQSRLQSHLTLLSSSLSISPPRWLSLSPSTILMSSFLHPLPSAWNSLPCLLHLTNSYSTFSYQFNSFPGKPSLTLVSSFNSVPSRQFGPCLYSSD